MIVLVGGIKGGTGKSTLASNLAVVRSSHGYKTLLVDADEQHSVSDWAEQRAEYFKDKYCDNEVTTISLIGKRLFVELNKLVADFDSIIVDAGGRDTTSQRSALIVADCYVIPFKPRSFDIWTINSVKQLYEEAKALNHKLTTCVVINQADPRGSDTTEAYNILTESKPLANEVAVIGNRKSFPNAASEGLSVCEKGNDIKAQDELMKLYTKIYG